MKHTVLGARPSRSRASIVQRETVTQGVRVKEMWPVLVGGVVSLSLLVAGSPMAYAATPTAGASQTSEAVFAKSRVKVTLVHDDSDGVVVVGAPTVLKGRVTGERAGQIVYLEEKVRSGGKARWRVIDRIKHNGRYSFTVAPEHGTHEFRARVRTTGVRGTQSTIGTRMKVAAPTGGDPTSGSVSVVAAPLYGIYVQNSTAASGDLTTIRDITFNYGLANSDGTTAKRTLDVKACPDGSCVKPGSGRILVQASGDAALAWSVTAESDIPFVDATYFPDTSDCPAGFTMGGANSITSIVISNPNTFGLQATVQTATASCTFRLLTKAEKTVANWASSAWDWCKQNTYLESLCITLGVVVVGGIIVFSGGSAPEGAGEEAATEVVDDGLQEASEYFFEDQEGDMRDAPYDFMRGSLSDDGYLDVDREGVPTERLSSYNFEPSEWDNVNSGLSRLPVNSGSVVDLLQSQGLAPEGVS